MKEFPIKYVRIQDMHDRPITRDKMPMISVGALKPLQDEIRALQGKLAEYASAPSVVDSSRRQIEVDLQEAINLLTVASPNPLGIKSEEYWDRFNKLTDKYLEADQDSEDEED